MTEQLPTAEWYTSDEYEEILGLLHVLDYCRQWPTLKNIHDAAFAKLAEFNARPTMPTEAEETEEVEEEEHAA